MHSRARASSRFIAHDHILSRIFACHRAFLRFIVHHCVSSCIIAFHRASSCLTMHLRVPLRIFAFHHASSHSIAHLCVSPRIFAFHCASSRSTVHLHVSPCIFAFHRDLVCIIAGASIHCPASSLVRRIPFIIISDYVWHHTIIISLWTLTLHHLHAQSAPDSLPSPGKALMCDLGLPCLFLQLSFWQSPSITS